MKRLLVLALGALASVPTLSLAQPTPAAASASSADSLQNEIALVTQARAVALSDDDAAVDAQLLAASTLPDAPAPSILLARRAMILCGWLQNEGERARAAKIATRALAHLAKFTESTDADREERLYWEACLEARILDHKARAVALLRAAEALNPDDERVIDLELPLVAALTSFGR